MLVNKLLFTLALLLIPLITEAAQIFVDGLLAADTATYNPATRLGTGGTFTAKKNFPTDMTILSNGDILEIRGTPSGAFTGLYLVNSPVGGSGTSWPNISSAVNGITVRVYSGDSTPIVQSNATMNELVSIKSRRYITIEGIEWDNNDKSDRVFYLGSTTSPSTCDNAAGFITLRNNVIHNSRRFGILTSRSCDNLFVGNTIKNNGSEGHLDHGFYHTGSRSLFTQNILFGNAAAGIHNYHGSGGVDDNEYSYNTLYDNAKGTCAVGNPCSTGAVVLWSGLRLKFHNNKVYSTNNRRGIDVYGNADGVQIYNNVVDTTGTAEGIWLRSGLTQAVVRNNSILTFGALGAIRNEASQALVSNNTTTGVDTDLYVDPNNATLASRDFRPKSGSALINAGTANICTVAEAAALTCATVNVLTGFVGAAPDNGYAEFGTPFPDLIVQLGLNNNVTDGGTLGNNGTANSITYTTTAGLFREGTHAAVFNANTDYITIPIVGLDSPDTFTIQLAGRATALSGTQYLFACNTESPTGNRIYVYTEGSQLRIGLGSDNNIAIQTVVIDTYYYVNLVKSQNVWEFYVDGLMVASGTVSGLDALPATCTIGNWGGASKTAGWAGYIDIVQIYRSAHTQEQITADCILYCVTPPSPPDLEYVALVLDTGGSTDVTSQIVTIPFVTGPIDPNVCLNLSDFVITYSAGNQPTVINCLVTTTNIVLTSSTPVTSGVITITVAYEEATPVAVTNNYVASGVVTGMTQRGWACRNNPYRSTDLYRKPQNEPCFVQSPGGVNIRFSLENTSGSTISNFPTSLECKKDAGSFIRLSNDFGSLDLKFNTGDGLINGFPLTTAKLSAAGGITAIHVGTIRRSENQSSLPSIGNNQQYEEEYALLIDEGLAIDTQFVCRIVKFDGSALNTYIGSSGGAVLVVKPPTKGF